MKNKLTVFGLILSVLLIFSCKDKQSYTKMKTEQAPSKSNVHKIVVKDIIDAGTYVYLEVSEDGKEYWMAIPSRKVDKGGTYYFSGGMVMKDFESEQLERTFDYITFVEGISESKEATTQPKMSSAHEHDHTAEQPKKIDIQIEKAKNGISIGELYEGKSSFKGKEVIVRGKVVKVNNGILDRNWIHIVDGTSFNDKSDLTITTSETIKVGSTVTVKGTVTLDKDFGYGYVYNLLIENGEIIE